MSIWNKKFIAAFRMIFRVALSMAFAAMLHYPAGAQNLSRVNHYTVTPFQATWTDISATADTFHYSRIGQGYGTIAMPFDFPYDDSLITAGTKIKIGASGAISLSSDTTPLGPALDSPAYPGLVCIFSTVLVQGKGHATADSDYYEVDGTAPNRVLTVQYHFVHMPGSGSGGDSGAGMGGKATMMQVKFYETSGAIEFIYLAHNNPFEKGPIFFGGVGLNGFSTPKFVAYVYDSNLTATPPTDIRWTPGTSGVAEGTTPDGFALGSFYPDPANNIAQIPIALPREETLRLDVHNASGAAVKTNFLGAMSAGNHTIELDTKGLPNGIYFCTISCGDARLTRQMTIVR